MTTRPPVRYRRSIPERVRPWGAMAVCAAIALLSGCKSSKSDGGLMRGIGIGGGSTGSLTSRGDPLLGGARIPPQNLPIPGRGESAQSRDPLLGRPRTTGDTGTERTDRGATGKEQASIRRDDPYRPTKSQTNAALAGRTIPTDDTLSIGDRTPEVTPASGTDGPAPFRLPGGGTFVDGMASSEIAEALRKIGATIEPPERTANGYAIRVTVPIGQPGADGRPGLIRQYEGVGTTAAAAAADALNQIRSDMGR